MIVDPPASVLCTPHPLHLGPVANSSVMYPTSTPKKPHPPFSFYFYSLSGFITRFPVMSWGSEQWPTTHSASCVGLLVHRHETHDGSLLGVPAELHSYHAGR